MRKIISIIPARGGSKGIPNKNIKIINNIPLVAYSIIQSLNAKRINQTYVSTDNKEIMDISSEYGAKIIARPEELARDDSTTESALLHAAEVLNNDFDYFVLLQPTSPLRYSSHIDEAITTILKEKSDSLLSVYENDSFLWNKNKIPINYDFKERPRRQDKSWEFVENGSIYITKREILLSEKNRLGGKISFYIMPKWMSFEVDEPFDLELVKFLFNTKYKKKRELLTKKIQKIKIILFDVDGVFTDGTVIMEENGKEFLKFSRIDGKGIELIKKKGLKTAIITSENSNIVKKRMQKLNIDDIYIGIKDKLKIYNILKKKYKFKDEEFCFLGDDVQDLAIMQKVGFSCCPCNAQKEIKMISDYISVYEGGYGFVRDVCNLLLGIK